MNPKNYIKLRKVGTSISYKDLMEEYSGNKKKTYIGGRDVYNLEGWWWADPNTRITQKEMDESKPRKIKNIIVIVHGRLYAEESHGRISKSGNLAFITQNSFSNLF